MVGYASTMPYMPEISTSSSEWFSKLFKAREDYYYDMKLKQEVMEPGLRMGGNSQYCLRWNNHRNNLLAAFDQLLHLEALTDVTLACEEGVTLHAHRLVLAACSSYFQALFVCARAASHPIVVLKDVRAGDMRALLHYMYRGEVNVNHDDLPALLSLAETLKVKGLVEELNTDPARRPLSPPPARDPSRPPTAPLDARTHPSPAGPPSISSHEHSRPVSPPPGLYPPPQSLPPLRPQIRDPRDMIDPRDLRDLRDHLRDHRELQEPPRDTHTPGSIDSDSRSGLHPLISDSRCGPLSLVPPLSHLPPHCPDSPPHKRKRPHMLSDPMLSPTPILRTALAHSHGFPTPDMSSLVSLASSIMPLPGLLSSHAPHLLGHDPRDHLESQYSVKKEHHDEDTRAFPDISRDDDHDKMKMESQMPNGPMLPDFNPYHLDPNGSSHFSNFVSYVPTPKPEWKRYKQYTKADLMEAIEEVRNGMTALQASRKYKVPSRTLYDKIKKMGISTLPRRLPNKKPPPSNTDIDVGGGIGGGLGGGLHLAGLGRGGTHDNPHAPPPPHPSPPQPQHPSLPQPQHPSPPQPQHPSPPQPQHPHTSPVHPHPLQHPPIDTTTPPTPTTQDRESHFHQMEMEKARMEIEKARMNKSSTSDDDDRHSSSVIEDDDEASNAPTPAVGSFSLVGRKLYENGNGSTADRVTGESSSGVLDLTESESLLPSRPEIEERA